MKFCVAQTRALPGDIPGNIHRHCELAERAARSGADAIVFPELSLTGYEPTLAQRLAADANAAQLYIASVAKTPQGAAAAHRRLAEIARHYAMPVMMSNCIGSADGEPCGGGSAIWNSGGECLAQLDAQCEGLLYLDTATDAAAAEVIGAGIA